MFHYFKGRISHGFVSVYTGRMILNIAGGLLGIFVPIFLYVLFDFEIKYVFYYQIISHLLYAVLLPWGCQYLNRIGLRRSLHISIIWGAFNYLMFYFLDKYASENIIFRENYNIILLLLGLNILFITLYRLMYWIPLHTDLAKFTSKTNRGKQLSLIESTIVFFQAIMPLASGWILYKYNYDILFLIAIIIFLLSLIPFMTIPRTHERFCWTYWQTWREFFSKKKRKTVLAYTGDGAESIIGSAIWPIFIWELLHGNYFEVGALTSLIVFISVILQLFVGKYVDIGNKAKLLRYGSVFYAIGWLVKIFIVTAFHIFVVSTYHNLAKIFSRTSFNTYYYEISAEQGHYVDEYTVIHEMAVHIGVVIMMFLALGLTSFFSIQWTFILAAISSLAMNFIIGEEILDRA